jgi:fructose-bisphosphate aldolase class I
VLATQHLSAINELDVPKPWALSFSFGRALQDEALEAWRGRSENVQAAQRAFLHRAKCESAAALGKYRSEMESEAA